MIKRHGFIVWLAYFDKNLTRSEGRRVPLRKAVKSPTHEQILKVAERLGWKAELLPLCYPSFWWKKFQAVRIYPEKSLNKKDVLNLLASELVKSK